MKRPDYLDELPAKIKVRHIVTENKKKTAMKQKWVKRDGK